MKKKNEKREQKISVKKVSEREKKKKEAALAWTTPLRDCNGNSKRFALSANLLYLSAVQSILRLHRSCCLTNFQPLHLGLQDRIDRMALAFGEKDPLETSIDRIKASLLKVYS